MPRLRLSPCRREVRPLRATSGQHETEILAALGLGPSVLDLRSVLSQTVGTSSGHRPLRPLPGGRRRDSPRPLLPPFPSVPEMCLSRRSAPRDNSGIATSCPATGYNAGTQFCGAPHNGLFEAHNVSHDAVMGCGDVFTTAKYRRPRGRMRNANSKPAATAGTRAARSVEPVHQQFAQRRQLSDPAGRKGQFAAIRGDAGDRNQLWAFE